MKFTSTFLLLLMSSVSWFGGLKAQDLNLDSCLQWARHNYPNFKQLQVLEAAEVYNLEKVRTAYLPRFMVAGQASYQSDVTSLPISLPNMDIPEISQDQYRLYGEFNQSLTALFTNRSQQQMTKLQTAISQEQLDLEFQKLKDQLVQIYFGILSLENQAAQLDLMATDLRARKKELKGAIANGVILPSDSAQLRAEQLKLEQGILEVRSKQTAFRQMLSLMIGKDISQHQLMWPNPNPQSLKLRPELNLLQKQQDLVLVKDDLLGQARLPQFNLFFQGGYGRPALNMLNNDFDAYYIGGLRLSWNISSFYTLSQDRKLLGLEQNKLMAQKETFLFHNRLQLESKSAEQKKLLAQIAKDEEIVSLRALIKETAAGQLREGTIRSSEYLQQLNEWARAKENLDWHRLQLLLVTYQEALLKGY